MHKPITLVQIHYHLRLGGVTRSIIDLHNNFQFLGYRTEIWYGGEALGLAGNNIAALANTTFIPALSYNGRPDEQSYHELEEALHQKIASLEGDFVLWIHNGNLGKNPALTEWIWKQLNCIGGSFLGLVLHSHDFADDRRPQLWNNLSLWAEKKNLPFPGYVYPKPFEQELHWLCLNQRDFQKLQHKGIPATRLHHFPNLVHINESIGQDWSPASPLNFRLLLKEFCQREGFRFEGTEKILLAPLRPIKRKNLLESVLIQQALGDKFHLLISLDPGPDDSYASELQMALRHSPFNVSMGFGAWLEKQGWSSMQIKQSLFEACEMAISTSTQEGFGYTLLEPWLYHRAVFGRIPNGLQSELKNARVDLGLFYHTVSLRLSDVLREQIAQVRSEEGLEPYSIRDIYHKQSIDFAQIPFKVQIDLLLSKSWEKHFSLKRMEEWKNIFSKDLTNLISDNAIKVRQQFGMERRLQKLLFLNDLSPSQNERKKSLNSLPLT